MVLVFVGVCVVFILIIVRISVLVNFEFIR